MGKKTFFQTGHLILSIIGTTRRFFLSGRKSGNPVGIFSNTVIWGKREVLKRHNRIRRR